MTIRRSVRPVIIARAEGRVSGLNDVTVALPHRLGRHSEHGQTVCLEEGVKPRLLRSPG
jgi:hypothetical protein